MSTDKDFFQLVDERVQVYSPTKKVTYNVDLVYKEFGLLGFIEMLLFISILLVGFFYVWKKGDLDWVKMEIRNPKGRYQHLSRRD